MLDTQGCRNPGGMGDISPPIIWLRSTSVSPPIIWLWSACESLEFGEKSFWKTFFFGLHLHSGKKLLKFWWRPFFFGLHIICWLEKYRGRGSSLPMLKIGQNWGKIANYSPQSSTKIGTPVYTDIIGAGFRGARVPTPPLLVAVHLRGVAQNKNILKFFVL